MQCGGFDKVNAVASPTGPPPTIIAFFLKVGGFALAAALEANASAHPSSKRQMGITQVMMNAIVNSMMGPRMNVAWSVAREIEEALTGGM
jgi:hypothetical protein